jgi:predicted transcriptional regulator/5S rRNA maturation endonuclease (ribonuclease M5)
MRNESGQIVNLYGRSIFGDKGSKHYYLKGKLQGLYPRWPSQQTERLILCESHIDTVTVLSYVSSLSDGEMGMAWQCLSLYGTNGFTADHVESIGGLKQLKEVVLFLDGDAAGQEAIRKLTHKIRDIKTTIVISYVSTDKGEDPNSIIVQAKETERSAVLTKLIEDRKQLVFSSIDHSVEESKGDTELPWDEGIESNRHVVVDRGQLHSDHAELLLYTYDRLQISLLGGIKVTGLDRMRVTVKVERRDSSVHLPIRHSLDLYHAKQVDQLAVMISDQLDMAKGQIELLLSYMTSALEGYRAKRLDLLKPKQPVGYEMSASARNSAIQYLKSGALWDRTIADIAGTGIIGERSNALITYMAYTSRKREKPLHIMCLGASGTGKTYLQEKIGSLIPDEEKIEITSLSDNALYYFGRTELKHKLILIEDLDGAENVLYPLRELQSKRRISKTVTTKDNKGNLKTLNLTVEGPVSVSGCTTRERIYEDNANRCILLYIDDSKAQDRRIMDYQRKASAGVISTTDQERKKTLLQNVQRVLRPIRVINPYAEYIDLPPEVFKPRRTLLILLSFIETITYYHQYQREIHTDQYTGGQYIKSTIKDIELSFKLMQPVLFAKSDELSKGCRRFLERLKSVIGEGSSFYTQDIRRQFRLSSSTVHRYIRELKNNGYIRYKGGNRQQGYEYKINDYDEYKQLRSAIDDRLNEIIESIKNGIPEVSQEHNGINKSQKINALA